MNDIEGPAANIPEFLAALTLLQVRGCTVTYRSSAPNAIEVYEVKYVLRQEGRTRLMYPDHRGTQQALWLLKELNDYPTSGFGMATVKPEGAMFTYDEVFKTGLEV